MRAGTGSWRDTSPLPGSPEFLHVKEHEDSRDDEERANPFQEPARIAQNLDGALSEVFRVPGSLRHFEGEPGPGAPPFAGVIERVVHPALPGAGLTFRAGHVDGALEARGTITAFVALHFEIDQL